MGYEVAFFFFLYENLEKFEKKLIKSNQVPLINTTLPPKKDNLRLL